MAIEKKVGIRLSYAKDIRELDDISAGRLIKSLLAYAQTGEAPQSQEEWMLLFDLLKGDFAQDTERAKKRADINRENGKKGGRPRKKPVEEPKEEPKEEPAAEESLEVAQPTQVEPAPRQRTRRNSAYSAGFEAVWRIYPRKENKGEAYREYQRRLSDGYSPEELMQAAQRYADECKTKSTPQQYIRKGRTFFGMGGSFEDYLRREDGGGQAGERYEDINLAELFGEGD